MILPLNNCKITSRYGIVRKDGKVHKGVDFISTSGDMNVKAIRKGVVSFAGYDSTGFGNYVVILQEDGFKALYCHLKSYSVKENDFVEEGQIIGIEGSTGNSTGVHLHLELRKAPYGRDDHIDVAEYLYIKNENGPATYKDNYELLEYLGILDYWRQGYKGQGIKIASRESKKTEHGRKVAELLKYLVPKSTILLNEDYNDEINDFNIYTTSLSFDSDKLARNVNKSQELFENNKFLVCAVGNHSSDSQTAISKNKYFQSIGACSLKNGKPVREYYSSITNDLDFMCLTNFKLSNGVFNGSSCSAPIFASMICLLQSAILDKFNKMLTNKEMLALIKQNLIDLETEGHDSKTGHGLFILPKPWNLNYTYEEEEDMPVIRYKTLEEIPDWGKTTVEKLMKLELLKGDENGNLDLSHDMLRIFVIEDRAGLYDF